MFLFVQINSINHFTFDICVRVFENKELKFARDAQQND